MFNAPAFCTDYNIPFERKREFTNIYCPMCGRRYYGGIHLTGKFWCWKCGGHYLSSVISKLLNVGKAEAETIISDYELHAAFIGKQKTAVAGVKAIDIIGAELAATHRKYLKRRGFDPDFLTQKYGLTGTLHTPMTPLDFRYRIMIPIFQGTRLVSYQGRDITGKANLRYKALPPEMSVIHYKQTLYGEQFAAGGQVAVVEGVVDQWRMGDGFVCTYGTALTAYQLKRLACYDRVYFVFDPGAEANALKYARELAALKNKIQVEYIDLELPVGLDPGGLSEDEAKHIRRELNFI